jgi:ABC-type cobalt transport system substrate-binding protein
LTLNGATIDIGSGGFAPGGADFGLDLGTGLLQTDGDIDNTDNGITWATSTIQITDNITYFGTVVAHDLIIDIGKTLIIDDGPGTGLWTGVMTVNGTLDTITNGDIMQTGTGAYPAPLNPIVLGPSGDLTSANISLRGTAGLAINAPAATYYDLSFSFSSAGTTTFGLAGDIVVTNEFWINTITSASRILNFSTNDYNITCNSLFQTGPGTITVSLNDSNVDIGADGLVIATNGVLNGNTSSIELAGDWTNSGTFISGDSTLIINGTVTQNITSGADTFSTVNITNTNSEINFTDDTNITNSTWGSGTTVILSSNMTINSFNATDFVVNSSIPSVTRYLFVPLANRTISNTTFNNVILVPPLFTFPIFNATAVDPTLCYPYTTIFFSCETWVITDIDAVWANISTPGGSFINATMSSAGGDNYTYDQVFIIPGNYSVIFWANDSYYGNANSSAQINFTVLPRPYGGVAPPTWDGPTGPTPFPSDEVEAVDFVMDNSTAFIIIGAICLAGYIMITTQRRRRQDRR